MRRHKSSSRRFLSERLESRNMLSITPLAGDFSGNNSVGQEDYDIWAQTFGSTTDLRADGNSDGRIDAADYTVWRDNDGQTRPDAPFLNLVVDTLDETLEDDIGAIVFLNSDFSKQDLYSIQPTNPDDLPVYQPDYFADPSIYDPNANQDFTTGSVRLDQSMVGTHDITFTFPSNVRLWTTEDWGGLTDVGGGRFQIPSGTSLTPDSVQIDFQIEGIGTSQTFGTSTIDVDATPTAGGGALSDEATYTVVDTAIGVDGNRDTKIDYANSQDRQLIFWFNSDQEGQHPTNTQSEFEET